ncbi:PLD nuclease N-terminal domain-containing protein [Nocardioides jejuensis]|uniref:PLDc_N domain-containing protein n=1 Tax=Nocardioides jejuensis TaxID=2502782 RepID=A0A4R1C0Y2_9ACTN|nr:PLD nuclease N-terminal domain-containing protein [Nocardioides jejuensis]TCJ24140.1 PLDc_N domain-containing protein [Nocardioides jejuensis]
MIRALPFLVELILMIFCLVDAISAPEHRVRNLPKWAWILLILIVPLAGGIAWLVAGRPTADASRQWAPPGFPEYDRPGRATATNPDDDEAFLRKVRERAEEQRRRYAEEKRKAEKQDPDAPQE